ncbi:MAG TPA: ATP-binding protein [Opitutaceae bacterium]|nr:ATP-binding protein [Opitutaceae bacterium]
MNSLDSVHLLLLGIVAVLAWALVRASRARSEAAGHLAAETGRLEKLLDDARRDRSTELESLLDQMIESLIAIDAKGNVRLANRAAARLFGFALPASGKSLLEVARHHELAAVVGRLAGGEAVRNHEFLIEGTPPRYVRVNAVVLPGNGGALLVFRDETELRRLEANRRDFVANVSHELRTPLSMIKGAVENLQDGAVNDPVTTVKFLEMIDRHAGRLGLLIEDLLLLSELDSGRVDLKLQDVQLREIAAETIDDLTPAAAKRGVTMANDVHGDYIVRADTLRLKQILSNLVENAIRHGRENGEVTVTAAPGAEGWLRVTVRDDGPGVPEAVRERIFERFFRVDKARARHKGGTGLGLSIVKNLVLAHGGEVRVDGATEGGSVFSFTLRTPGGAQESEA